MLFTREDLVYQYSWTATGKDDPVLKGEPDCSVLNRNEGYEVLYMIQHMITAWHLRTIADGQRLERMIKDCPGEIRSQVEVKLWISYHYTSLSRQYKRGASKPYPDCP